MTAFTFKGEKVKEELHSKGSSYFKKEGKKPPPTKNQHKTNCRQPQSKERL